MECNLAEKLGIKLGALPKDINASAIAGERVSLADAERVSVVVAFDAGAEDVAVTFQEHDAATAGNSQAIVNANAVYVKLDAETEFTKEAFAAADANGASGVVVFEFLAEDLDRADSFSHISADVAAGAAAKVVSVTYVVDTKVKPAYSVAL